MGIPDDKVSNKILIWFSFWCLLAVPIHYFTCSVERNSIPPLRLNKNVVFRIQINLHCVSESEDFCITVNNNASHFIKNWENVNNNALFALNINHYFEKQFVGNETMNNKIGLYNIYLIQNENENENEIVITPQRSSLINIHRHTQMTDINESILSVVKTMIFGEGIKSSTVANIGIKEQIFSFTLLNSEPQVGYDFRWNMSQLYETSLAPFFNRIHNLIIYNHHVDSQILHYGTIVSHPPTDDIHIDRDGDTDSILQNYIKKDSSGDGAHFMINYKDLQTFVGGTHWNRVSTLTSDISPIQVVIYIPPKKYVPLHIEHKSQRYHSFLVPRFGACIIYNPNNTNHIHSGANDLQITFNSVISQLRLLFGLRNENENNKLSVVMDKSGINEWELDILIRNHIINDLETVQISLKNINDLVDTVSQLPIKKSVASLINDAVYAFNQALQSCTKAKYRECIQWTRHSHYLAKKAEYHPTMLPALYFSPEFTYAVYSPYFLPGYIPIIAAIAKKLKAKYKQFRDKT